MSMWVAVLLASALAFALKLVGYVIPGHWLEGPRVRRVTAALPIALLAALVGTNTFVGGGGSLHLDARAAAVGVALVALALRAPFIVVVALAALVAALLRIVGMA